MNSVIEEIEILKKHTREALEALKTGEFDKVKEELQKIIVLDIDELKRLHKDHGPKIVVRECRRVFEDAKKALHLIGHPKYGHIVSKLIAKIYYLLEYEEREELNMENLERQELRSFFYSGAARGSGEMNTKIGSRLHDANYREMYAQVWEEAIRNASNWASIRSVMLLGYDPHQKTVPYIDPRNEPSYRGVKHAIAQKLRELDPSKDPAGVIRYIMDTLHPGAYELKKGTYTERVRTGWGPFKKTKEEEREYESKVLRPLEQLIRELESS